LEENRDKIGEDFASFIRGFRGEEGQLTYLDQLRDLPIRGGHSLVVDFQHLVQYEGALASELEQNPREMFKLFSESGLLMLTELDMEFARKVQRFNVRVSNYQRKVSIRSLNSSYIGKMVSITGVVVRSSEVMTQLKTGAFRCMSCQTVTPADQVGSLYTTPRACPVCNRSGLGTFELEPSLSTFEDFQSISLQERPEDLPAGQMPQTLDLALTDDLVSSARPGDRVVVTGMVNVKQRAAGFGRSKSRVFELSLDTNHIAVETGEQLEAELDEESIRSFRADASQPWHYKKLISSIAPSIHGMENVKEAVLLQLAGGNPKEFRDGIKVRGDVNVLLVGDPGCYSGDTRLVLGDGSMPTFRELAGMLGAETPGIYPVSLKVKNRTEEQATALHIYEGQPVIEITLASGRSIRATPNNPFFTSKGWRRADQLKVGTSIRMRRRIHSDIKDYHPTAWKLVSRDHSRNHVVSVPEVVDERLAALIGILTAEGYVDGSYSIALAVNQHEKQLAASTAQTIKNLFGYEPSESVLKRNGKNGRTLDLIRLRVTNPHIVKWLNPMVKEKRVPSSIFMSPDNVVASYVRWLFEGDGNVRSQAKMRDRYVALSSKSMELLRDIQLLLLRFGVESHIYAKSNKKECFVLRIRDARSLRLFARYIGFVSERKRGQLNDLLQGYSNGRRLPERSVMDHILKIERRAPETVYDLEVPKTNSLIVNGIIGHNTAKSQLLKYIQKIAPRGLYTSGRGATAAGLTAAAIRDETGAFSLEAGALVLADKGLAAIDEFEKMREEDRVAIHEAMEQQSYHPSVEIMLADGRRTRIGEYVDGLFKEHGHKKIHGTNCEILPSPASDEILSADTNTGSIRRFRVDRVSRHTPPDKFVSITYSNGREILVTPEHPVFVYRGRRIVTVPAAELKGGDFAPAPRTIAVGELTASKPLLAPQADPREKDVTLPDMLTADIATILGYLVTEGCFYRGSSCEISFTNKNPQILREMENLMRHTFGIRHLNSLSSFGVPSQRYISSRLYKWFELNFPEMVEKARNKRAPSRLFHTTSDIVRAFMRSAFLGDGSVESEAVCYRTASRGLAEDYQDLLLMLGVASRVTRDSSSDTFKTYVAGDSLPLFREEVIDRSDDRISDVRALVERSQSANRSHDVIPTDFAHLFCDTYKKLGIANDGRFNPNLDAGYGITVDVAKDIALRMHDRIGEIECSWGAASSVQDVRSAVDWSQQHLADAMLVKRGTIDYCERGGYSESVRLGLAQRAKDAVRSSLSEARGSVAELYGALRSNFRALRIRKVRFVPNEGKHRANWVYDVTVEPTHNFVSQGVLLHNTCSIAKGGIVATLNARTSILAAANPQFGRYDLNRNFAENVNLSPVILSRFDLYFVLRDVPDETRDALLTAHIIAQHRKMERAAEATYDTMYLKRYVAYAKVSAPKLSDEAAQAISRFFLDLRKSGGESSIHITPRQLESLIRESEARAKLMLRDIVTKEDVEVVIALFRSSLSQAGLDVETGKTDIDILMTGKARSSWEKHNVIVKIAEDLEKEFGSANIEEVLKRAEGKGVDRADGRRIINDLLRNGYFYTPDDVSLKKTR